MSRLSITEDRNIINQTRNLDNNQDELKLSRGFLSARSGLLFKRTETVVRELNLPAGTAVVNFELALNARHQDWPIVLPMIRTILDGVEYDYNVDGLTTPNARFNGIFITENIATEKRASWASNFMIIAVTNPTTLVFEAGVMGTDSGEVEFDVEMINY